MTLQRVRVDYYYLSLQGVAYLLGQFTAVLQCFSLTTGTAIANLFTGIAQVRKRGLDGFCSFSLSH